MTRGILIRPAASRDLDEHARYIARDSGLEVALRFYDAAEETFTLLRLHPLIGRRTPLRNPFLAHTRMPAVKNFGNYVVFYRPVSKGIEIVRVIHGSRDFESMVEE
ncbi:MAG: type II toxin-antitoxin system RelE/ParE family toxin [Acidobacteriia bacterium]|nr:type II toxin-antitoxin system RelE/ParE family toxin [Terriglobia bacterium]